MNPTRKCVDGTHAAEHRQPFDAVADSYVDSLGESLGRFGESLDHFVQLKVDLIRATAGSAPVRTIVDVGCGVGLLTERLARVLSGTRIVGIDPSPRSLEQAAARCRGLDNVSWRAFDGTHLPDGFEAADIVVVANVLHHIAPGDRPAFLRRVLRPAAAPAGRIMIFEHNPYNPVTRLVVRSCPYDRDAVLLTRRTAVGLLSAAGIDVTHAAYVAFFPGALRSFRGLERHLGWLPVGAQYFVVGHRGDQRID